MSVRRTALAAALPLAALLVLGACSSSQPTAASRSTNVPPSPARTEDAGAVAPVPAAAANDAGVGTIVVPNMVGQDLQLGQDTMQAAGLYSLTSHDATGQGRMQILDRNWKVCDQSPTGGSTVASGQEIDFGSVKDEEKCP